VAHLVSPAAKDPAAEGVGRDAGQRLRGWLAVVKVYLKCKCRRALKCSTSGSQNNQNILYVAFEPVKKVNSCASYRSQKPGNKNQKLLKAHQSSCEIKQKIKIVVCSKATA